MDTNNAKIVNEAARLFMEKGIEMTSVTEVMAAAGLTHGGFYRHFKSKDELVSVAIKKAVDDTTNRLKQDILQLGPKEAVVKFIHRYLSEQHINNPGKGCPIPTLGAEVNRKLLAHCDVISHGSEKLISLLAQGIDGNLDETHAKATGLLATLVGTLILARSTKNETKREQIRSFAYDLSKLST